MNEVITKRAFGAPVQQLYKAWSAPQHLQNWWGPHGFTNTFHEFDFKPGGYWRFMMHGPEGKHYYNESHFAIIELNRQLVFNHITAPAFNAIVNFEAAGTEKSILNWHMVFEDEKVYETLKDFVSEKNEENLDRHEAELKKVPHART